jgi:type IV pilus assembly protein PilM
VDSSKVAQIVTYEAQQNVPFPLEEVVWDYQILGAAASGELEVLLVAIKNEIVDGLFQMAGAAGVKVGLVDVSSAALCNSFRFSYGDLEGCTMLLDIGAKTSNLLFFEKGKIYSRSINIGANSITQDFANESKLPFGEAERIKVEEGFVSLGGAYEEPENPHQAAISKIARQILTRLHIQVNQTIQFYRGQQGGSAPQRLYLCGGGSVMTYTREFFQEKLAMPVEYFNPFRGVELAPTVEVEALQSVAHHFGETVGVALRSVAHCPVELNLTPKGSIKKQELSRKTPYFIASVASLILGIFAIALVYGQQASVKKAKAQSLETEIAPLTQLKQQIAKHKGDIDQSKKDIDTIIKAVEERFWWVGVLNELNVVLTEVEAKTKASLGADCGVWIEAFTPIAPGGFSIEEESQEDAIDNMDEEWKKRYGKQLKEIMLGRAGASTSSGNELERIQCVIRAVNLHKHSPDANYNLMFALKDAFTASPVFGNGAADTIQMDQQQKYDTEDKVEKSLTFAIGMNLKLKRPLKF